MKKIWLVVCGLIITTSIYAQKITPQQYIQKYHRCAIRDMNKFGIPASITLAQGMLESNYGNSVLATQANNHFGIKCAKWNGKTIHRDDDKKNECFRAYDNALDSYDDHSEFLKTKDRYSFLFSYSKTDYKSWAYGLKKAGYATNPKYPEALIKLINDYDLHKFDLGKTLPGDCECMLEVPAKSDNTTDVSSTTYHHTLRMNNGLKYVRVEVGDSYNSITKEFALKDSELFYYNELPANQELVVGNILYIKSKRNKAARGNEVHVVRDKENLWQISQIYGVKLSKLRKYNNFQPYSMVKKGDKIWLRGKPKKI